MQLIRTAIYDVIGLLLPQRCACCDEALMGGEVDLCITCIADLPRTYFHEDPENLLEQLFWGKLKLNAASALLRFDQGGRTQKMLHRLKYRGDISMGRTLGRLMAQDLKTSPRFQGLDLIVPVPLHPKKLRIRGFNQSEIIAREIGERLGIEVRPEAVVRERHTESQTRKGRMERWKNVGTAFSIPDASLVQNKHVLLVDDVVTTGATIEGCGVPLSRVPGVRLSLFAVAHA